MILFVVNKKEIIFKSRTSYFLLFSTRAHSIFHHIKNCIFQVARSTTQVYSEEGANRVYIEKCEQIRHFSKAALSLVQLFPTGQFALVGTVQPLAIEPVVCPLCLSLCPGDNISHIKELLKLVRYKYSPTKHIALRSTAQCFGGRC